MRRLIEQSQAHRISRLQLRSRPPIGMAPVVQSGLPWPLALGIGVVAAVGAVAAALCASPHPAGHRAEPVGRARRPGFALVMQPGQDSSALALAIRAVAPNLRAGLPVPSAKEG